MARAVQKVALRCEQAEENGGLLGKSLITSLGTLVSLTHLKTKGLLTIQWGHSMAHLNLAQDTYERSLPSCMMVVVHIVSRCPHEYPSGVCKSFIPKGTQINKGKK